MNRSASVLTASVILASSLAVASPASASGCVTKTEFYRIKPGQSIGKVVRSTGADFVSHRKHLGRDGYWRDTFVFPTCPVARRAWGRYVAVYTEDTRTRVFVVTGKAT